MALLDTLMHETLSPVEAIARHAPKVLGWLDRSDEAPAAHWAWLDTASANRGLEITECQLPEDLLRALFGTPTATAH